MRNRYTVIVESDDWDGTLLHVFARCDSLGEAVLSVGDFELNFVHQRNQRLILVDGLTGHRVNLCGPAGRLLRERLFDKNKTASRVVDWKSNGF